MRTKIRRIRQLLWHSHQGLWNWDLLEVLKKRIQSRAAFGTVESVIVTVDSLLLRARVISRRIARLGFGSLSWRLAKVPPDKSIIYFDLGMHQKAAELTLMAGRVLPNVCGPAFAAFGFEASNEFFQQAQSSLKNPNVTMLNVAVCSEIPPSGKIRLFKNPGDGLGSSLYRQYDIFEDVDAIKLSDWITTNKIDIKNNICLLRMNIEGAEEDVIRDLISSGLAQYVDGYLGMWDDLSKINPRRDEAFKVLLQEQGISPVTFNGRDLCHPHRVQSIEFHIETCILAGLKQKSGRGGSERVGSLPATTSQTFAEVQRK